MNHLDFLVNCKVCWKPNKDQQTTIAYVSL